MTVTSTSILLAASGGPDVWVLPLLTGGLGLGGLVSLAVLLWKPIRRR